MRLSIAHKFLRFCDLRKELALVQAVASAVNPRFKPFSEIRQASTPVPHCGADVPARAEEALAPQNRSHSQAS